MTERLQRRDDLIARQHAALEVAGQKSSRLQLRMQDLFGAEAAELEPPKLQYTAKPGDHYSGIVVLCSSMSCCGQMQAAQQQGWPPVKARSLLCSGCKAQESLPTCQATAGLFVSWNDLQGKQQGH